ENINKLDGQYLTLDSDAGTGTRYNLDYIFDGGYVPEQNDQNFNFNYGTTSYSGDLYSPNEYSTINSQDIYPGGYAGSESSVYSDPDDDAFNSGWTTAPLSNDINDGVRQPSTTGFSGGYITGEDLNYFYVNMENVVIPANNYITQVRIWARSRTTDTEWYEYMTAQYRFSGYTSWSSAKLIGDTGWTWDSATWPDLFNNRYGDAHADALQVRFDIERWLNDDTLWDIEAVYAQIYYAPLNYMHALDFTSKISTDGFEIGNTLKYAYQGFKVLDQSDQTLTLQIWDNLYNRWDTIQSSASVDSIFLLDSIYYNENNEVLLKLFGENFDVDGEFVVNLDILKIIKTVFTDDEKTGIEDYFVSLDYSSAGADFELIYIDDTGTHSIGTLPAGTDTTFTASFSPTLLDTRLGFRIISSTDSVSLYIDRIVLSSNSTDKPSNLIITADTRYDLFYADLEFDDVPSLVNSLKTNIPLTYEKTSDTYYVFKISEIETDMAFTINRLKITDPSHAQNITIIPRDYYHWADDEIYIEIGEVGGFYPVIDQDSTLHVDYAYIYDSWRDNEYVDTQPYVYNFSVSAAQRIEAVSFFATFSEIPQIQSWFFGFIDDETEFKQLTNKLYKDVNLLDIQFYDSNSKTWNTTDYVVYDRGDRDARTFGYFIDRTAIDFIRFDMLPKNDLIYQLKYRFKIDKNYFKEEYSTKTFFDIQELTVKLYYKPVQSVVSLNPRLKFSADITDIIQPEGNEGITNHVNELAIDIDWKYGVSVEDYSFEGVDIGEVFLNYTLYSQNPTLTAIDKFGNKYEISKSSGKFYLKNTNSQDLYNFIQYKYGKYFIDFVLDYEWKLKGMINFMYDAIFDINAYVELINCEVRAKVTTVHKELITPFSIPKNSSIYIGDITNDSISDIGFMGGLLEKTQNNDRFLVKYQFSYLYDANNDDLFDSSDPQVYFAEYVQDISFTSVNLEGFLFFDEDNLNKTLVIGDEKLLELTTSSNVDEAYLYVDTLQVGQFSPVQGTSNKFTYNWTNIEQLFAGTYTTGDEVNITIRLVDIDSGINRSIIYTCLLDFEAPTSTITIGNGQTDYSLSNFAAPWTNFSLTSTDNLEGLLSHDIHYYENITTEEFQVKVYDINDILVYSSGFIPISIMFTDLFDLGIPVNNFEDHNSYYYIVEFKITDAAGNSIINASYLGDLYSYAGGSPKIFVSNEVTIQFENNLINVNDLYNGIGNIVNFTLIGSDGSELKNQSISLKTGNYYLDITLWNETTQTYTVVFEDIYDLILYSDNIFTNELYANYEVDWDLNWYAQGSDYYAFAKHASQEDPLVLTYFPQKERFALIEISEQDSFRIFDYLNYIDVYCYVWNNDTEAFDTRISFTEDNFTIFANGTVSWNVNITSMNVKDDQIIFKYYSSDYANIVKDTQKNGMFLKVLIPNLYSTHSSIESLQIQFVDFDNNVFTYSIGSLDFDEYFKNTAQYKRVIPG
ncbi:hypothetical protein LCGC14_1372650, partial [marine sediment metagenome]